MSTPPLLELQGVIRSYQLPRLGLLREAPRVRALDGVSLAVRPGESVGIVGESGSGKSTLARLALALERPDAGTVRLLGRDPFGLPAAELRALRRHVQMVFQDPYGSLDPRHRVGRIIAEPLHLLPRLGSAERRRRVIEALADVGLEPAAADRFPHAFSGGQRQRIAIARALITRPALVVADEPVSALDVSIQAQVLNLMMELLARHGLAYLFIGHDLSVVRHVTDRVVVMRAGRVVEAGPTAEVLSRPTAAYTRALLDAVPIPDPARRRRPKRELLETET